MFVYSIYPCESCSNLNFPLNQIGSTSEVEYSTYPASAGNWYLDNDGLKKYYVFWPFRQFIFFSCLCYIFWICLSCCSTVCYMIDMTEYMIYFSFFFFTATLWDCSCIDAIHNVGELILLWICRSPFSPSKSIYQKNVMLPSLGTSVNVNVRI